MHKNKAMLAKNTRRNIVHNLEILYENRLIAYDLFKKLQMPNMKPTNAAERDRQYRAEIKATELLLHVTGSKLFENAERPSLRKTLNISSRLPGAVQS